MLVIFPPNVDVVCSDFFWLGDYQVFEDYVCENDAGRE